MDKRTILAVTLSLIVLIGWSYFFQRKPVQHAPASTPVAQSPVKPETQTEAVTEAGAVTEEAPVKPPLVEYPVAKDARASDIVVETDLYRAVISTQGAIITSWQLKNFKDSKGRPVMLLKKPGTIPPLGIIFESGDRNLPQKFIYSADTKNVILSEQGKTQGELTLTYRGQSMYISKKFVFHNDSYNVDFYVKTVNTPSYLLPVGTGFGIFDEKGGQRSHHGPVVLSGSDKTEFSEKSDNKYLPGGVRWIAQEDQYFTAAIIPLSRIEGADFWKEGPSPEIALRLKPGEHKFILYAGPKEYDRLKQLNAGLEHIIDFGWFSIVAMPLFWVLKFFYKYLGNYGWSIILLTILVRVPFIPILHKSQQSMKKMQKLQPLMAELKEKYKKDPQRLQKETMLLYKKHKVNPVGGCLPLLLQIPVFIALYNVLLKAIELRGAPFILWITDLSAKDPYYVLPIVMGLTMVIQQKMTPTAMDPKQAKIMMLMPIVFTFMFLTFPAGL
ncbi:MAG: membrane protein insertase YidC, partial [Deferribacteres bacterium]|nr:membrane protein insertase YidC [Deferribacteres bacterium]